jgi:type IX secretion system PorP/SprF family membrane protein
MILSALLSDAQDLHFTQYYLSPLSLNPANTGRYRGDYALYGNYRSQWKALGDPYNTYSAGFDMNTYPRNLNVSAGLLFISDRSGGDLVVNKIMPSGAYHHKWRGFGFHFGIQPSIVIKSFDLRRSSLPEQMNWSTGVFDHTMPSTEDNFAQRLAYFDPNIGLVVNRRFGRIDPELGVALQHLTRPRDGFVSRSSRLPVTKSYNLRVGLHAGNYIILRAHSLFAATTGVNNWLSGLNIEYVLSRNAFFVNTVYIGAMYRGGYRRNADASIVTAGLNFEHYTFGISYDVTSSSLNTSVDNHGAFELAFIYRAKSTRLVRKQVDCARH